MVMGMTTPLRTALQGSRALTVLAGVMSGLVLLTVIGLLADDRMLGGQPIWLKPFKFSVSFVVYAWTLAWLLAQLRRGRRIAGWTAVAIAAASYLEVGLIVTQAARGQASHFNDTTEFDAAIWRWMGITIMVLWLGTAILTVLLWRDGMPDRVGTWAVRWGMVLMLAGLLQGFFMLTPTAAQLELDERGVDTPLGAHAVGVPDGGPGMPITGWSTTGGDLRVGHFIGIHALQAVLLTWMLLSWLVRDAAKRVRLLAVFAFGYAGLLTLVTWQALRGQPLTDPDAVTLGALAGLAAVTVLAGAIAGRQRVRIADRAAPLAERTAPDADPPVGRQPVGHGHR